MPVQIKFKYLFTKRDTQTGSQKDGQTDNLSSFVYEKFLNYCRHKKTPRNEKKNAYVIRR